METASKTAHTPVIAVTAHAFTDYRQQCFDAGMDDYLAKPFTSNALEDILSRWLDGSQEEAANRASEKSEYAGKEVIDATRIAALRELDPNNCNGLVTRVVSLFLVTIQQNLEKMRAHRADNREAPQRAAHSLISSAAQVGAMQVSVLAAKVEESMRLGDAVELESLLTRLEVAVDKAAPELNALVNSTPV